MLMSHVILLALAAHLLGHGIGLRSRDDFIESNNRHVAGLNSLVMEFSLPAALFIGDRVPPPRGEMMEQGPFPRHFYCVRDADSISTFGFIVATRYLDYPRG